MNLILCGLVLAAAPALAESVPNPAVAPVTVYYRFDEVPDPDLEEILQEEVADVMEPAGFQFEWRELNPRADAGISAELVVVTFHGSCEAPLRRISDTSGGALGRTHTSGGEVLPFVDVDCNRIQSFISSGLQTGDMKQRMDAMGRAVARVLAHEFFHVLAKTRKHGGAGIAKSCHSVQDLLAPEFHFDPREARILRESKAHEALERSELTTAGGGQ
jgi:hypothetical protein